MRIFSPDSAKSRLTCCQKMFSTDVRTLVKEKQPVHDAMKKLHRLGISLVTTMDSTLLAEDKPQN